MDEVELVDADDSCSRLGPALGRIAGFLAGDDDGPAAIFAEIPATHMHPTRRDAYLRFEAASNRLYAAHGAATMCAYDSSRIPSEAMRAAHLATVLSDALGISTSAHGTDVELRLRLEDP
jgi:hypothetical protein